MSHIKYLIILYELATLFHAYWSKGNEDQKYKFIENGKFLKRMNFCYRSSLQ